ncbi:MAG: hypothetical protein K6G09_04150 [Treponema sp.]|nr:hypothetical protein [Treponema sp.]
MKNTKDSEYFTIHYEDKDQLLVKEAEGALNENLRRLMAFFNLSALSGKITVDIYSTLEEWIAFIESKGQTYQDFIVGLADNGVISVLSYDQYKKTQMHKDRPFEDFLQIIVHECVHICNYERIENPNNSVCFIMEGLATYLSNQAYNPNVKSDYNRETMCNYQTFYALEDPYSLAQILVRKMLKKMTAEKVIQYSGSLEKLWNDWEKIFG